MAAAEQEVAALQSGHGTARGEVNRLQGRTEIEHRHSGSHVRSYFSTRASFHSNFAARLLV
jgi:hypothetical protein